MANDAHRGTARSMLEKIRAAISAELLSLGVSDLSDLRETILIRDGLFCGRKFRCSGHSVVWFMEENQIKFFSPTGELLLASSPEQCLSREASVCEESPRGESTPDKSLSQEQTEKRAA